MTHRCVWDIPGTPFPAWVDFGTEEAAHLFALRKSRELGTEVAVIAIAATESPAERLSGSSEGDGLGTSERGAQRRTEGEA